MWHVTHNSFTEISAEGGIPALILFLLIFWRAIRNLRKVRKRRRTERIELLSMALKASLAAYLTGAIFLSYAYSFFPYCLVGYSGALLLIARRDQVASARMPKLNVMPERAEMIGWQ
jgi:O-antigen ligase